MARQLNPAQQKISEKLIILNDRGVGILTRIYNIKKACGDAKSKPGFLSDKSLESSIKFIVKRFPNIDTKGLTAITNIKVEVIKSLSLYYYTFVDLLDFKDNVCELLTTMDALQIYLDITVNHELTKNYLDLVTTYVSLMILLSRVEDRKAVLGLFNAAYEMQNNGSDPNFPRLGQLIIDYDQPTRKLSEEFIPHQRLLTSALKSLVQVYPMRNLTAEKWRELQILTLVGNQAALLKPSKTDTMSCEYVSLETMDRWIIFGLMLNHQMLGQSNQVTSMWIAALESSWVIALFRDEVIYIHQYIQNAFEGLKGYSKRISEVKDCYSHSIQKAALMHRERRKFLRTALKELALILTDQPGLLGPKALYVLIGLCYARDEILWLLRHNDNPPISSKAKGKSTEDLIDRQLPELLFHMEELRGLVRKYSQVIQRYYVQYLSGYDAIELNVKMQNLQVCPEEESIILSSLYQTIAPLTVKQVEMGETFDFRAFRLDWFRLQCHMSVAKSPIKVTDHVDMARLFDSMIFHTRMIDNLDETLVETSDLSIFCFYSKMLEDQFHMCLEFPAQNRYIIAFPLICSHFQNCTHEMCPEERHHILERSISVVNMFLDEMAKEAKNIITALAMMVEEMNGGSDDEDNSSSQLTELKGFLQKWTNYIHGWQLRFIVLKDSTLSYYKSAEDSDFGCRGAICLEKAQVKESDIDNCRFEITVNNLVWYLRAENPEDRKNWVEVLRSFRVDEPQPSLKRHGSTISIQSNTLSTTSGSSLKASRNLQLRLNEVETYRDILGEQITTLQQYFDACAVSGGAQNLETEHGLRAVDFKGEAITFRETTSAVLTTLNHCLEIIMNKEDGLKKKLDREMERRKKAEDDLKQCREELRSKTSSMIIGPDLEEEGPNSTIPEDEFYDAVETGLEKIEEVRQIRVKLKLQNQQSQIEAGQIAEESRVSEVDDFGTGKLAQYHNLWPEISKVCDDQLHHAWKGVSDDNSGWQLFAEEGEMKMYRREEEIDGMVMDPLKSCHVVKGCTAREMCHYFFEPAYRNDWETTLEDCQILEEIAKDTLVFLQTHKRIWPANQRDALFWSHMRKVEEGLDQGAADAWIVCNHSTDSPNYPSENSGNCIRILLTVILLCQTFVRPLKEGETLTRNDLTCKITYCSVVNPGGWVKPTILRAVYKKEYPKFLKRFTGYVLDTVKNKPIKF